MLLLEYLDRRVRLKTLLLCSPAIFLLHDAEEILTVERFWQENQDRIPLPTAIKERLEVTTSQMAASVAVIFVLGCMTSYLAAGSARGAKWINLFTTVASIRFVNVFFHLLQTLMLRRYTPGIVTAPIVVAPCVLYIFHRLHKAGLISKHNLFQCMGIGAILHTPVVIGAQTAGRLLVSWSRWRDQGTNLAVADATYIHCAVGRKASCHRLPPP